MFEWTSHHILYTTYVGRISPDAMILQFIVKIISNYVKHDYYLFECTLQLVVWFIYTFNGDSSLSIRSRWPSAAERAAWPKAIKCWKKVIFDRLAEWLEIVCVFVISIDVYSMKLEIANRYPFSVRIDTEWIVFESAALP